MESKKAMSALFKLVVVFSVVIILVLSLVVLIIKLGKSGADVLDTESFGFAFLLSQGILRKFLKQA